MAPTAPAPTVVPIAVLLNIEQMRLDAWRAESLPLDRGLAAHSGPGGTAGLINMVRGALAPLELRSEPRVLLPRPKERGWVLPLIVVARNPASPAPGVQGMPLVGVLTELARDLGDPSIVAEATNAIRDGAACDELMTRVTGEGTRTFAQVQRDAEGRPWSGSVSTRIPWVVAGLPEHFSLTDLHRATMAWLGVEPSIAESPSNFRRRVQDLIAAGVLQEIRDSSRASDPDRPGRPPRLFQFAPYAWLAWMMKRAGGRSREVEADFAATNDPTRISAAELGTAQLRQIERWANEDSKDSWVAFHKAPSPPESGFFKALRGLLDQYDRSRGAKR